LAPRSVWQLQTKTVRRKHWLAEGGDERRAVTTAISGTWLSSERTGMYTVLPRYAKRRQKFYERHQSNGMDQWREALVIASPTVTSGIYIWMMMCWYYWRRWWWWW
jgi:hypothetical protein